MLKRTHQKDDAASVAIYSDCERYRYSLTRVWDETGGKVHFVMLNPSTATEVQNDPTVERCERRARALGYGAFRVTKYLCMARHRTPKKCVRPTILSALQMMPQFWMHAIGRM
jgi:hypothetical protein